MDEQKELDLQVAREEEDLADGELDLDEKDFWEDLTVFEEPAAEAAEPEAVPAADDSRPEDVPAAELKADSEPVPEFAPEPQGEPAPEPMTVVKEPPVQEEPAPKARSARRTRRKTDQDWFGVTNGRHLLWKSFIIALMVAILMFLPSIVWDEGYFLFLGDFNAQQVPFYILAHKAVRAGNIGWNWYTDLGANFIGSYTFYLLGSPFFWITLPFPESWVPYLMGPLLILKYALMSMIATAWLRRYVKRSEYAILGGLLYAFSGYTMYNTFFNHFLDVMVFFPLMLIGMDELVENNRRGVFAASVALCAIVNYVFFAGEAVFMVLYFIMKVWRGDYKTTFARFLVVGFEAIIGFGVSAFLVWPSLIVMLANPRSSGMLTGYNFWIFTHERKPWVILLNFFFPPELPSQPILLTDSYMRWTSVQAYIPLFSMAGVIAFVSENKKNWLKSLIFLLLIMAFIPGLNSMFTVMNSSYYARWYFMLVLMMVAATVITLDRGSDEALHTGWKIMAVFTLAVIAAMVLTPKTEKVKNEVQQEVSDESGGTRIETSTVEEEKTTLGIYNKSFSIPFYIMAITCVVSVAALYLILDERKKRPKLFVSYLMMGVCLFGVLYGNYYLVYGKTRSYDTKNYIIPDAIHGAEKLHWPTDEFFRIDNDDSFINMGMFWQVPDMHAFHSVVPVSIMDYYEYIGDNRDVNSKMDYKRYASRSLFSVRYFADRIDYKSDVFGDPEAEKPDTKMPGYTYLYDMAGFAIWENNYYIPMGFTYDAYILKSKVDKNTSKTNRDKLMVKALILTEEQEAKYIGLMRKVTKESEFIFSESAYFNDCLERAEHACDSFSYDNSGFKAHIDLDAPNLVFFSVPYEKDGWTATVNGKSVEVENVQIGFMAVLCEAGSNDIVFTYHTPGLDLGIKISVVCTGILILYTIAASIFVWRRKRHEQMD